MTENEIIKALKCCITNDCAKCKAYDETSGEMVDCLHAICRNALDLINRQKAEIERLEKENNEQKAILEAINDEFNPLPFETDFDKAIKTAKAEAIKEFAGRLKEKAPRIRFMGKVFSSVDTEDIDNLVKEMVGDAE